ncbi:hypothetical protein ATE47_09080 [Chryseobacterium sp. IHB B 17019]|jgi:hypothetical protein|uniref:hypothetical protein n=1 Tax=Chryseobacterium sp. IHB B 17019 TaxID=1721091 RepID=UPI000720307C|nr:hypothetical protein [Chryseobacterium sp. IHB B 17019]ALR30669.1 hypothetical protein ATE47_09080 [Chryseobacterium sp. IHB B 17019]
MNNVNKELNDEKLLKKRDLLKGASIGLGIVYILAIAILIYLFVTRGTQNIPLAIFIPVFAMIAVFIPLLINLGLLNKEIKSRNL